MEINMDIDTLEELKRICDSMYVIDELEDDRAKTRVSCDGCEIFETYLRFRNLSIELKSQLNKD